MRGASAHRRLIYTSRKALRRHRGQRTDIARPGDAIKVAAAAAHMRHVGVTAQPDERPVERTDQPRHAVLLGGARRAAPLIGRVEEPHAREIERLGDLRNFRHIGRARAPEPVARRPVEHRHKRPCRTWEEAEAGVAQGAGARGALLCVARCAAVAQIDDRNIRQIRHRWIYRQPRGKFAAEVPHPRQRPRDYLSSGVFQRRR